MKKLAKVPLTHQPGERWTYGLNMDLLGYLIEVISGQPLDQFFKIRIFDPLGMKDTYFYLPASKHSRLVIVAGENEQREAIPLSDSVISLNGNININYPLTKGTLYAGGAGLVSTAFDYAIFMQMLLNNGTYNGKRLLSPKAVTMMRSEQFAPAYWNDKVMGLAFSIYTDKSVPKSAPSAGSYEGGGFFSSSFWIDPEKKIVAQIFLNQFGGTHGDIHNKFKVLVYA